MKSIPLRLRRNDIARAYCRVRAFREDREAWERRQLASHLENCLARERDLDRELAARPTWSDAWWRTVRRLDEMRIWRLELERQVETRR